MSDQIKQVFAEELNRKARALREEYHRTRDRLDMIESEEQRIAFQCTRLSLPTSYTEDGREYRLSDLGDLLERVRNPEKEYNQMNLVNQARDYIHREYNKSKYEGRELSSLFGQLFELIDPQLRVKLDG
jgi:hypothetical protein